MISMSAMIERAARLNPKGIATSYGGVTASPRATGWPS